MISCHSGNNFTYYQFSTLRLARNISLSFFCLNDINSGYSSSSHIICTLPSSNSAIYTRMCCVSFPSAYPISLSSLFYKS